MKITSVASAGMLTTLPTVCKGADKTPTSIPDLLSPLTERKGVCPECDQLMPLYLFDRGNTGAGPMNYEWRVAQHDKPFNSHCAECGVGMYQHDYLCPKCRAASL